MTVPTDGGCSGNQETCVPKPSTRKFQLSPTKIRTYRDCPAKYRWEYIEKLGRFYRRPKPYYSFGTSIHSTLDAFAQAGGPSVMSVDDIVQQLRLSWVDAGYASPADAKAKLAEAETIVIECHAAALHAETTTPPDERPELFATEKTYSQDITPDVRLTGRIDRIDTYPDGTLDIVDYKSGRMSVTEADVAGALPMRIYQTVVKHHHPDRPVRASIYAVRSGMIASHSLSDDERVDLIAELAEEGEMLRNKDFTSILPVFNEALCDECDYRPHCDRIWKDQRRRGLG